ncbi:HAD-IIA family hydrolase [Ahrensia sp. R2A130]|uniref:HAD-IIA family hydrolase n=1 Tax=Ahrensia sp. R2A130 TaxID=744979 RepID=UPI0001E0BC77|nr:HAD hydrolase-like protein [Ahrensia sp. R2A130]EFL89449.1 hydrolase [Ahrensia sp. R2A130]
MLDNVEAVFQRYEDVRHRVPVANPEPATQDIASLIEIARQGDAFVFDAFGVLNVGETPIDGAAARLNELRSMGVSIRILTNAASYDRGGAIAKFAALGMDVFSDEIITSRDAALAALPGGTIGCIAAGDDALADIGQASLRLGDAANDYDAVDCFLFLSSAEWTESRQDLLSAALAKKPRAVLIANADLVAPRGDSLSIEPGHYGHLLCDAGVENVRFFGKPFPEVYELAEASLTDIALERIIMCGDTLHTDISGATSRGWKTVLVTADGLFAGFDTDTFISRSGLNPTWRLPQI